MTHDIIGQGAMPDGAAAAVPDRQRGELAAGESVRPILEDTVVVGHLNRAYRTPVAVADPHHREAVAAGMAAGGAGPAGRAAVFDDVVTGGSVPGDKHRVLLDFHIL